MNYIDILPDFSQVSSDAKRGHDKFYQQTSQNNIAKFAEGDDLEKLTNLAKTARNVINFGKPCAQIGYENQTHWEMAHLSDVKKRLASAIQYKRDYYENHWVGKIKKFFLQKFDMWNGGATKSIEKAEDFLLFWNAHQPLIRITHPNSSSYGKYRERADFPSPAADDNDIKTFYDYTPIRPRPIN